MNSVIQYIKYMSEIRDVLIPQSRRNINHLFHCLESINYKLWIKESYNSIIIGKNDPYVSEEPYVFDKKGPLFKLDSEKYQFMHGIILISELEEIQILDNTQLILSYGRNVIPEQKLLDKLKFLYENKDQL